MSDSDSMAEQFVVELEERAKDRAVLTVEARQVLLRHLSIRLEASHNPGALLLKWQGNADQYVRTTLGPRREGVTRVSIRGDTILRQLNACSELCPGPERLRGRNNPTSGSQDAGA